MRRLVLVLALLFAVAPVRASPCIAHCRDKARACKMRCKLKHPHFDDARHTCLQTCELREQECRANSC